MSREDDCRKLAEIQTALAGPPQHLYEVLWWQVDGTDAVIRARRAVFYLHRVAWADHPWGKSLSGGGADFENVWTLETKWSTEDAWSGDGRTGGGWERLRLADFAHLSEESALDAAREVTLKHIHGYEQRIAEKRNRLTEIDERAAVLAALASKERSS